jgi:beta-1,3-galactosyl-O-glycosyl-glycoprotein beta-1,6-N-acetylglucosaminyltransferase
MRISRINEPSNGSNKNSIINLFKSNNNNNKNLKNRYFLNMASSEFPLRTNYELTRILTAYNGSNEIEIVKYIDPDRIEFSFIEDTEENRVVVTNELKADPPHNFTITKGYAFCVISRNFAEYAIWDASVKDLLEWGKDTFSPDEWYYN